MVVLEGITKTYRMGRVEVAALKGVTLRVEAGEMVAIMGPSGSGKSTLMNIVGCLDRPSSGSYRLDGREVASLSDNELAEMRNRKLGFVFQGFNLLHGATALTNVELPMLYGNGQDRRRRALQALERVGLAKRAGHHPAELSGGEQQRVAIARALVTRPAVLLADEPTGNLDTRTSEEIIALFQRLHREEGLTVVLVTHEPDIAACTGRTIHVRDGLIVSDERVAQPRQAGGAT